MLTRVPTAAWSRLQKELDNLAWKLVGSGTVFPVTWLKQPEFSNLLGAGQGFVDRDRAVLDALSEGRPLDQFEDQRTGSTMLSQWRCPIVPVGRLFIRVRKREHLQFAQGSATDLQANR